MSKSIVTNTALGTLSELVLRLSKIFFVSLAAKSFTQLEFGIYSYAISFIAFFAVFFDTGLVNIFLRESTENLKNINNINFLIFKLASTIFGLVLLIIISAIYLPSTTRNIVLFLGFYNLSAELVTFILVPLKAKDEYKKEAITRSISVFFPIFVGIVFILLNKKLEFVIMSMSISSTLPLIICFYYFSNFKFKFNEKLINLREISIQILPISLTVFLGAFYTNFDNVILAEKNGLESVAIYSIAPKIILGLSILPISFLNNSLQTSFGPKKWNTDASVKWIYGQKLTFSFGLLVVVFINVLAKPIILIIFGEKYLEATQYLNLYSIVTLMYYAYHPMIQLLIMRKDHIKTTYTLIFAGIINFVSIKTLIPIFNIYGAVISAIFTHFMIFLLLSYFSIPHLKSKKYFKETLKTFLTQLIILFCLSLILINLPVLYNLNILTYAFLCCLIFFKPAIDFFSYTKKFFKKNN